jgi:hypothetical protein
MGGLGCKTKSEVLQRLAAVILATLGYIHCVPHPRAIGLLAGKRVCDGSNRHRVT